LIDGVAKSALPDEAARLDNWRKGQSDSLDRLSVA
jgi:hypothetical protein